MTSTAADVTVTFQRVRPGEYTASTGHVIKRANHVNPAGLTSIVWRVFYGDQQVREGTRLDDAKREVRAHVAQQAKGLA